jgi:RNA polymerase sigma factor (TIGR02999 family)
MRAKADTLVDGGGSEREELDRLLPFVYDELRRMAHRELRRERRDHTLTTTDLVHEAYLNLVDQTRVERSGRVLFFAAAAIAMRRILIEYARRRLAAKRGGGQRALSIDETTLAVNESADALLALDEAITRLAAVDERVARVVEYRYFGGLTEDETAEALEVTSRTVRRDWVKAKAWLYNELRDRT